ncbi:hypothetical protein [Noviherbaspirillum galbum]|uniref:Uncharacterized protein n=1 Tax=Noviherbaspirillum galbum TaxID=2709383 RepID=A0A6B3SP99_9BURK|nr:hypothetical protein [Noviherbaspirillum galbum]NEX62573.1 hypothetical protein [Noviherbaspirillum galbum]
MAYLAIAAGLALAGVLFLLKRSDGAGDAPAKASAPQTAAPNTILTWTPPPLPSQPVMPATPEPAQEASTEGSQDPTRDLSFYVARGEKPTMPEVIDRLHQEGIYSGLGAFNPPGFRPPLVGLAVPEDFVLPPGYVRHYQATDDGQRIEAILMYSPDYQFVDAANQPVAIPKDRVVPPEHAPPGMPIRRIAVPAPTEPR